MARKTNDKTSNEEVVEGNDVEQAANVSPEAEEDAKVAEEVDNRSVEEASSTDEARILTDEDAADSTDKSEEDKTEEPQLAARRTVSEEDKYKIEILQSGLVYNGAFFRKGTIQEVPEHMYNMSAEEQEELYGAEYFRKA